MKKISTRIFQYLYKYPASQSLRILFFSIFIFPVIIICSVYVFHLYTSTLNMEMEKVYSSLIVTESEFQESLMQAKSFSDRIYVNKRLQSLLLKKYENPREIFDAYAELSFLEDYLRNYQDISSFRIYVNNDTLLDNSYIAKTPDYIYEEGWYNSAVIMKGHVFWDITYDRISNKTNFSLVRSLWTPSFNQYIGILVINLDPDDIQKKLSEQLYDTFIYYYNDNIFSSTKKLDYETKMNIFELAKNNENSSKKYIKTKVDGQNVGIFSVDYNPFTHMSVKFKILYIIPLKQLSAQTKINIYITAGFIFIMILLALFVFFLYSKYVNLRVLKVQNGIEKVVKNNFELEKTIEGHDEFAQIYDNLYLMSENIKKLINEVYKQNLEKEQIKSKQSDMSFKMLATQINPHFLFNTIETIRMKSLTSGDKEVSTMLKLLAQLLRYNLSVKGQPVSIKKELEAVKNYLTIQHFRFGERISYDIKTNCNLEDVYILPLIIQPIVENSFTHGLENREKGGKINIFIDKINQNEKEILVIKISDNGSGIKKDQLEKIRENLKLEKYNFLETSGMSIGLVNVTSRIKLYYKNGSDVEINSQENDGTEVILKLVF